MEVSAYVKKKAARRKTAAMASVSNMAVEKYAPLATVRKKRVAKDDVHSIFAPWVRCTKCKVEAEADRQKFERYYVYTYNTRETFL
jgi:hypothetical protein